MGELCAVLIAGGIGGLINAYLQDGGFKLPGSQVLADGRRIFRPGFLGNVLVGLAAAVVMWGLYGFPTPPASVHWQWAGAVAASLLAGAGGSRVISDQIDKKLIAKPPIPTVPNPPIPTDVNPPNPGGDQNRKHG